MSSPRKQSPIVHENLKIKQKLTKNWQKEFEQSMNSEADSNEGSLSKAHTITNQNSKRKSATEDTPQMNNGNQTTLNVSRSGRVRKVKGVFDPSDVEVPSKRKSTPILETEIRAKKLPKPDNNIRETKESSVETNATIRRKTINLDENGCQVCSRSDPQKGRFVNCIECPIRGHFTCLRNAKLISAGIGEKNWQCSRCLRCAACNNLSKSVNIEVIFNNDKQLTLFFFLFLQENLFKCITCFSSFHLKCTQDKPSAVTKSKFKCDKCQNPTKKKGSGFAGFSQGHDESNESGESINTDIEQKSKIERSASVNSGSIEMNEPPPPPIIDLCEENDDVNIKQENRTRSPTPIRAVQKKVPRKNNVMQNVNGDGDDKRFLESLTYDKRTIYKPHENIPDVKKWDCDEVYTYFLGITKPEYAEIFREHQIDGDALLLIKRADVIRRFNLKLGPALRLYSYIVALQNKHNNPILAWNEI